MPGSAFNVRGGDPTLERDPRGKSLMLPDPSRTPGGFLHEWPYEPREWLPLAAGWRHRYGVELGAVAALGSRYGPRLRNYGDSRDGVVIDALTVALEEQGTARYADFTAGAVGRRDQHYRATFGRYGDFRASAHFSELPKLFTDQARTVFHGAGSANLTLPAGLVPGDNTPRQIAAALQAAPPQALGFDRKRAGLDFEATPDEAWRIHAGYALERKTGTRPSGGATSFPGLPAIETIEPLDYRTHEVSAGAQWVSDAVQMNAAYAGSFFRNAVDALAWDYPLAVDPFSASVLRRGRMDLAPDNAYHNVKLDAAAALSGRARMTGSVSWSRMTQDDDLIAPTVNSGVLAGAPPVDLANWNTPGASSTRSAGARIDTLLMQLTGAYTPLTDLAVQAKLRHYEEDNRTRYTAFNPITGQLGYLGLDGGVNDIVPSFMRAQVRSIPYEYRKRNYGLEADYRLLRRTSAMLAYEREDIDGQHRERARTAEDRVRLALNNRDLSWATVRVSLEHARRSGSGYAFDPNRAYYAPTALLAAPPTLAELRKHDLADRTQRIVNGRINFLLGRDMDLAVSARLATNDYGADYGRRDERASSFNLEWSWTPGPLTVAHAYYGFQRLESRMAAIADDPAGYATGDARAGGAVYPFANRWDEVSRDASHVVGFGVRHAFSHAVRLDSGYSYLYAPYRTRYGYASPGALVGGSVAAQAAGDGMPDAVYRQQSLETSLRIALGKRTALRLFHRYERASYADWHYDGVPLLFADGAALFLGAGPQRYRANLVGIFFQYTSGRPGGRGD